MSYCRFQNTLLDLQDCEGALQEGFNTEDTELSHEEKRAMKNLIELCREISENYEDLLNED